MKRVDLTKLSQVVVKEGKTVGRCPACAAQGKDSKGNNLVVFPDGKFGCAAYPSSRRHNRQILDLAGAVEEGDHCYHVSVRRVIHPPSTVIRDFGRLGHTFATAQEKRPTETKEADFI